MQIEITLSHNEILKIISEHLEKRVDHLVPSEWVKLYVKSKNNYRLKTWEEAELKATTSTVPSEKMASDTEIKAEVKAIV